MRWLTRSATGNGVHATVVAKPVLEHLSELPSSWRVMGATSSTLYLARNEFVIALTAPSTQLMPNGISLEQTPPSWPEIGTTVTCSLGSISFGNEHVQWASAHMPSGTPA